MNIDCKHITDNWKQYTLQNNHNMRVSILDYGGIITNITVPDKNGVFENVVLGLDNIADYTDNPNCFGAVIGRVAGRIQDAAFKVGNRTFQLDKNEGTNHLHGGSDGFHQVIWESTPFQTDAGVGVRLTHKSADGESGYPGDVTATVTYILTDENELILDYSGTTTKTTPFTLTNHTYFNLSGDLKDTVHRHQVTMDSSHFLELDTDLIPTGNLLPVDETAFDFRNGRTLRDGIVSDAEQNQMAGNGYDHYFLFNGEEHKGIVVTEPNSGRILTIQTNQPGVVMYTANGLGEDVQLTERLSDKHLGVCFETQAHPASLHHKGLPDILLAPDETYQKQTVFSFDVLHT